MGQTTQSKQQDIAILLLRIGVGFIFIYAGWGKLTGIEGTQGFFDSIGIPIPALMAWVVAIIEFFGGILVLLGAWTRIPHLLLAIIMLVALLTTKLGGGFGPARLDFMLLMANIALFLLGTGRYAVDEVMGRR